MIEGGYAITRGIPADFWEKWAEQNKLADFFVPPDGCEHGAIFAYPDLDDVISAAREQEKYLTGMEPLSTDVDKNGSLTAKSTAGHYQIGQFRPGYGRVRREVKRSDGVILANL